MLIDTHCHLHDADYPLDSEAVLRAASARAVQKIIVIGTSPEDSARACSFAESHEDVFWAFGYHPNEFRGDFNKLHQDLAAFSLKSPKLVAIGEIGLDYHFAPFDRSAQIKLLETMLQFACDHKLPVSFHVRDAFMDFWPIIDNFPRLLPSVLHSFSDSDTTLLEALRRGFYFGVNGLATFANIPHPPLERVVLETDAPYLTPKPFRGKINSSEHIADIAAWASAFYAVSPSAVADITTKNAQKIFKL